MKNLSKVLALVLVVAMVFSLAVSAGAAASFKDDDAIKYDEAVQLLTALNVLTGYDTDGDGKGGAYKLVLNAYGQIEQINTATLYGGVVANVYTDVDSYIQYSWKHVATANNDAWGSISEEGTTIKITDKLVKDANGNDTWQFAKLYYVWDNVNGCYKPVDRRTGVAGENYFEMSGTGILPGWTGISDANNNVTLEFDTAKVFNYATGAAAVAKSGDTFFFIVEGGEIVTLWTVPAGTNIPNPNFP